MMNDGLKWIDCLTRSRNFRKRIMSYCTVHYCMNALHSQPHMYIHTYIYIYTYDNTSRNSEFRIQK